jgi:PilZ domain
MAVNGSGAVTFVVLGRHHKCFKATVDMTNNSARPRFTLTTVVMVRESKTGAAILAQMRNISFSGCYLETAGKLPQNGKVEVMLQAYGIGADIWGVVRRRDATGVGIQFSHGATAEDWNCLQLLVGNLQTQCPPGPPRPAQGDGRNT